MKFGTKLHYHISIVCEITIWIQLIFCGFKIQILKIVIFLCLAFDWPLQQLTMTLLVRRHHQDQKNKQQEDLSVISKKILRYELNSNKVDYEGFEIENQIAYISSQLNPPEIDKEKGKSIISTAIQERPNINNAIESSILDELQHLISIAEISTSERFQLFVLRYSFSLDNQNSIRSKCVGGLLSLLEGIMCLPSNWKTSESKFNQAFQLIKVKKEKYTTTNQMQQHNQIRI